MIIASQITQNDRFYETAATPEEMAERAKLPTQGAVRLSVNEIEGIELKASECKLAPDTQTGAGMQLKHTWRSIIMKSGIQPHVV